MASRRMRGALRAAGAALSACLRDRRGVALIEFAFLAPILLVTLLGIMQYGWILYLRDSMQHAADETAHYAMIHAAATRDELVAYAKQAAGAVDLAKMTVTVTLDAGPPAFVTVRTSYPAVVGVPFVPLDTLTLVGRARAPQGP